MKGIVRQIVLAISAVVMIAINLTGGGGSFTGKPAPDIYSTYPTAFTPAPYTFAVWGPIFLGVVVFAVYQALPSHREDSRLDALGWPLTLTYLATTATAFTPITISVPVLLLVLVGLIWAFLTVVRFEPYDRSFLWCVRVPISIFYAWISVATILNISQWLVSVGFTGWGIPPTIWAATLMLVAAALGVTVATLYNDVAYPLVIVWAFWGIVVAQGAAAPILTAAVIGSVALLAASAWALRGSLGHDRSDMLAHS
jgi:hypothetical protein